VAKFIHTKGLDEVVKNLNVEIKQIEGRTLQGLIRAGLMVLRSVEKYPPLTPVDLGNLRASRFLITSNGSVGMGRNPTFNGPDAGQIAGDHGNAISYAESLAKSKKPSVALGFAARYATAVHEKTGIVNWSRPGSGAKFFEKAIDANVQNMIKVIQEEVKIK